MSSVPSTVPHGGRSKILVTGMPRSGTTWLARLLAVAPGSALTGREPMNPRERQWALASTLEGWTRLSSPTPRQSRALLRAYRALSPSVYSRYGVDQWRAPLPWSRLIVKDPFAMLSLPVIAEVTGARPVLIHRDPGAMLVSYRRVGWLPDIDELRPIVQEFERSDPEAAAAIPRLNADAPHDGVLAMAWFWSALYAMALADIVRIPGGIVVSHELVATDVDYCRRLHDHLGVPWNAGAEMEFGRETSAGVDPARLHNFNRRPADAAMAWKAHLPVSEAAELDDVTKPVRDLLDESAFHLRVR